MNDYERMNKTVEGETNSQIFRVSVPRKGRDMASENPPRSQNHFDVGTGARYDKGRLGNHLAREKGLPVRFCPRGVGCSMFPLCGMLRV